jgi:hypothetical protein
LGGGDGVGGEDVVEGGACFCHGGLGVFRKPCWVRLKLLISRCQNQGLRKILITL